jgi:hypothetical protein
MQQDPLDDLLQSYAKAPLGVECARNNRAVWREIERRNEQRSWGQWLLLAWRATLAEPRLAIAALALAVGIGTAPSLLASHAESDASSARHSLHLEVFSTDSQMFRAAMLKAPAQH